MSAIPWEQVREVVDAVVDLPPEERAPYLDQACPVASVRRYVESLVVSLEHANKFMDKPAIAHYPEAVNHEDVGSWTGRRVGAYEVLEEIGQGGMGSWPAIKRFARCLYSKVDIVPIAPLRRSPVHLRRRDRRF